MTQPDYVDTAVEFCPTKKIAYGSRREARAHLDRHRSGVQGMCPYMCPRCHLWHLGHPSAKGRR